MKELKRADSQEKKDALSPLSLVKPEGSHSRSSSVGKSGNEKQVRSSSSGVKPLFDSKKKSQIPSIFASEAPPIFEEEKTDSYISSEIGPRARYLRNQAQHKNDSLLMNFDTRSHSGTRRKQLTGSSSEASMPVPQREELTAKQIEIFIHSFN